MTGEKLITTESPPYPLFGLEQDMMQDTRQIPGEERDDLDHMKMDVAMSYEALASSVVASLRGRYGL